MENQNKKTLITGSILVITLAFNLTCKSQPLSASTKDTVQILQEVISYPSLKDSLLINFKDQEMIILKNELINNEYELTWNKQAVKYETPNAINTSPHLGMPPRFVVSFPEFKIEGGKSIVVYRFKNVGIVAKFALRKKDNGYWEVVEFETWHI